MKTKDIRVNAKLIMKYEPCLGGLANFKKHYKDISIKELINSKNISYDDKIWLLKRIVNIDLLDPWAIDNSIASYKNSSWNDAQNERLQSLLYFIENED